MDYSYKKDYNGYIEITDDKTKKVTKYTAKSLRQVINTIIDNIHEYEKSIDYLRDIIKFNMALYCLMKDDEE